MAEKKKILTLVSGMVFQGVEREGKLFANKMAIMLAELEQIERIKNNSSTATWGVP
jgi:hypothetical protein